jgi:hypothetical protein
MRTVAKILIIIVALIVGLAVLRGVREGPRGQGENFAGELNPIWIKTWGGPGDDHAYDVTVSGGRLYVTGRDDSDSDTDVIVRKFDLDGNLEWENRWSNGGADVGFVIVKNGDYIYVGGKMGEKGGAEDALLLKYDLSGALIWENTWGTENYEEVDGLTIQQNTIYASVWTGPILGDIDVGLLRYDLDGRLLGSTVWESSGERNEPNGHIYSDFTGVYIGGGSFIGNALLAKFDLNGNYLWHKTWGGGKSDDALNLISDGDYLYLAGMTKSYGSGGWDAFLLKYEIDGDLIWSKTWGGSRDDYARGIAVDNEHVWVSGKTKSYGSGRWDLVILKYDKVGTFLGYKLWGGTGDDEPHYLKMDATYLYIAGETSSYGADGKDAFLMKVKKW